MRAILLLVLASAIARAEIHCVDIDADNGGDGKSWPTAFDDIQDALAVADYGDQIWVAEGTYLPGSERADTFVLPPGVRILGGWIPEELVRDPNPLTNGTVISGDIDGNGELEGNSYNLIDARSSDALTLLDGFTLTGGNAETGGDDNDRGGAISVGDRSPNFKNLRIDGNRARYGGGVHAGGAGQATFENVTFSNNVQDIAGGSGGAVYLTNQASHLFTNCLFHNNTSLLGGALRSFNCDPVFTNCTFVDNSSEGIGGAMYGNNSSDPTLFNCIVWNNTSTGASFDVTSINAGSANNLIDDGDPENEDWVISNEDPRFESATNFSLRDDSPALDAGLNSANLTETDLSGGPRSNGDIDLGAYERRADAPPSTEESLISGQIVPMPEDPDRIAFTFMSSFEVGTSYQPQYATDLSGEWMDLGDAEVSPVEGSPGTFLVTAPTFGDERAFYRVIETRSLPGASSPPVSPTIGTPPPEKEEQLILLTADTAGGSPVSGENLAIQDSNNSGPEPIPYGLRDFPNSGDRYESLAIQARTAPDMVAVDLTGNGKPDPVFAWGTDAGEVKLVVPAINGTGTPWEDATIHDVEGKPIFSEVVPADISAFGQIRVVALQLDDDPLPEIALAYVDEDNDLHLVTADFNGDPTATPTFSTPDTSTEVIREVPYDRSAVFDLTGGDFDGDPDTPDQIILVHVSKIFSSSFRLFTRFYDLLDGSLVLNETLIANQGNGSIHVANASGSRINRVAAASADFNGDGTDTLAVAYTLWSTQSGNPKTDTYLRLLGTITDAGGTITRYSYPNYPSDGDTVVGSYPNSPLTLFPIELDGDPGLELVRGAANIDFFDIPANRIPVNIGSTPNDFSVDSPSRRQIALSNLQLFEKSPNDVFPSLITSQSETRQRMVDDTTVNEAVHTVRTYEIIERDAGEFSLDLTFTTETIESLPDDTTVPVALVSAAAFDPLDIKLGAPRLTTRSITSLPTVILNAPPLHFDLIGGETFDTSGLFTDNAPGGTPFFSRFTRSDTTTISVETSWERSWDVSVTATAGVELPFGLGGLEAEIRSSLGQDFENYTSEQNSTTIDLTVEVLEDDAIYATNLTYNIWEYPVILNNDTVLGYIVLLDPTVTQQSWLSAKSVFAESYRPRHEVGNLLSYSSMPAPPEGSELVRPIVEDTFNISAGGLGAQWALTKTGVSETGGSTTFNWSAGATLSFDAPSPWIPAITLSGDYSSSNFRANSTTLTDSKGLVVSLGRLNGSIVGTEYKITPYVYWDDQRSGALVLDYAVDLPGGSESFWSAQYGSLPDPTFILPWRLDPEKGVAVSDSKRQQTRDIFTLPLEPRPGQDVEVQARISNFSFIGNDEALRVKIYLGEPGAGGTEIHSQTLAPGELGGRDKFLITFPYTIPRDIQESEIRIYAVLDPLNEIDEVHEDNNTAWGKVFLRVGP